MNDRIGEVNAGFADFDGSYEIYCECGDGACRKRLPVTASTYAAVSAGNRGYLVLPHHAASSDAEVVDVRQGYVVVGATRRHPPLSALNLSSDAA